MDLLSFSAAVHEMTGNRRFPRLSVSGSPSFFFFPFKIDAARFVGHGSLLLGEGSRDTSVGLRSGFLGRAIFSHACQCESLLE